MKTFLLISVMLIASLFVESRTVPDVHIRGTDIVSVQAPNIITIHLVDLDCGLVMYSNLVLTELAEPAPVYHVAVPSTLEGYLDTENPPPSIKGNQVKYNRHRDVWKFLLTDIAIVPNQLNYNLTSYPSLSYYDYNRQAIAKAAKSKTDNWIRIKRYPSTKARMC